jgi:SIT family siderophore-iron:H+ symporter-like MFS transporter
MGVSERNSNSFPEANIMSSPGVERKEALETDQGIVSDDDISILKEKSPGVIRIEAFTAALTTLDRFFIYFGIFLIAYVYTLDGVLRYTFQPIATASWGEHSLLATINVVRAVIAAAAQPTSGKIADVFGRVELICVSIFFYVLGTIVEAVATNVGTFAGGSILYQIGYTMIVLLTEVVVADISSTRARLFFAFVPNLPFLINTWVSGDISQAIVDNSTWQWGIGMWAIIYPFAALPLIISLTIVTRRAKKRGLLDNYRSPFQRLGFKALSIDLFWRLDLIGVVLVILVFGLILVPLTLAGGVKDKWAEAQTIAPLVIGLCCIPIFIFWELRAPHPLVPFSIMKDRGVWAAMGIALMLNFVWYMQGDFLYTVLIVAFDFSTKAATRITSLFSFVSVLTGFILGMIVFKVRRLKIFIVSGTMLYLVAFGLLIHFRGGSAGSNKSGVIGAQVLLGLAAGLFSYPTLISLQVNLKHENLAVMIGLYLATYNIGSAFGNTLSSAIWTNTLPNALRKSLAGINETLADSVYGDPFTAAAAYPIGTPERDAIIDSYRHSQRLLTITGICLCLPLIVFAAFLRNPKLNNEQTLAQDKPAVLATATGAPRDTEALRA